MKNKEEYIQKLRDCDDFTEHYNQAVAWGSAPKILFELFIDLEDAAKVCGLEEYVVKSCKEAVLRSLTLTCGQKNTAYAFELAKKFPHSLALRLTATMLALGQQKSSLLNQITKHVDNMELHGFYTVLLHEIVIRKELFFGDEQLSEIAGTLTYSSLSDLPLQLTTVETKLYSRTYSNSQAGEGSPTPLYNNQIPIDYAEKQSATNEHIETVAHPSLKKQCLEAVDDWLRKSNGKAEVRFGKMEDLETPIEAIIGTLFQAEFEEKTVLKIAQATPSRIISMLYSTAANGGAYSEGELGAYGRLKAWHSFLGLCGNTFGKDRINSIQKELEDFTWFEFVSDTWFYRQLSWDIGIVCIHTKSNSVCAMMGTDTD